MESSEAIAKLENELDSFDTKTRATAVESFAKLTGEGSLHCKTESADHNMHCHTFFSYNGYGFSPSRIACWAKREGLFRRRAR